jgi:two-component system response regulator NreC
VTVRLLLVEDHPVVREGLRALLEEEAALEVVGQAGHGGEVVQLVEGLRPDVVVLDLMMPGVGGLEVTTEIARRFPETRVLILSMHANEAYVLEALRNGAAGYALKQADGGELVRAILEVAAGRRYLSPPLSERAVEAYARRAEGAPPDLYMTLTAREREVLVLVAQGHTSPAIAGRLYISPRTVESHRASLMKKLRLRSQAEVIRYAIGRGIVPADSPVEATEASNTVARTDGS